MIHYALCCDKGHEFESWFQGSDAYEAQVKRGLVSCPHCGSAKVEKALMAPRLSGTRKKSSAKPRPVAAPAASGDAPVALLSAQEQEFRSKLRELREHLTANADNVGKSFADEARKMHYGEIEHRSIYGETSTEDAKALHEEGVAFYPLPVLPDEAN